MNLFENKKFLVVDDEPELVSLLTTMLQFMGAQVQQANEGKEALEFFRSQPDFDVVITDHTMPGQDADGLTLTRKIRETNDSIIILMVTGHAEEVEKDAKEAGVNALIPKPFKIEEIVEILQKVQN